MINVIGSIFKPLIVGPDGEVTGGEPVYGFHVNVALGLVSAVPSLDAFRVHPTKLRRVFAGDDPETPAETIALRFADEAEARAVLSDYWIEETQADE